MPHLSHNDAELDLHELTVDQAIDRFIRLYNRRVSAGQRGDINVIHGNTHGDRIKRRLHALLAAHADRLTFTPGEELDGNPGHTVVYPQRLLPGTTDLLASEILAFCVTPKTMDKITGKFHRRPYREIAAAMAVLVRDGQLVELKSGVKRYQAVPR